MGDDGTYRTSPKDTPVYFYAQLSKPMDKVVSWREGRIESNSNPERISGKNAGMAVRFKTEKRRKGDAESGDFICQCRTGT